MGRSQILLFKRKVLHPNCLLYHCKVRLPTLKMLPTFLYLSLTVLKDRLERISNTITV